MSVGLSAPPEIAEVVEPLLVVDVSAAPSAPQQDSWHRAAGYWFCSLLIHAAVLSIAVLIMSGHTGGGRGNGQGDGRDSLSVSFLSGGNPPARNFDNALPGGESWESEATDSRALQLEAVAKSYALTDPQNVFQSESPETVSIEALLNERPAQRNPPQPKAVEPVEPEPLPEETPLPAPPRPTTTERVIAKATSPARFSPNASSNDGTSSSSPGAMGSPADQVNGANRPGPGIGRGQGVGTGSGTGDRTQFFGIEVHAKRFVYVIDASDSMLQHRALDIAREELWLSLQELAPPTRFQVVFFNLSQRAVTRSGARPELLLASPQNLQVAFQSIAEVQTDSGTDRLRALTYALKFEPDTIFLLTDADAPVMSAADLNRFRTLNRSKAAVHVVEFGKGADLTDDNFLKVLARQNSGSHRYYDLSQ